MSGSVCNSPSGSPINGLRHKEKVFDLFAAMDANQVAKALTPLPYHVTLRQRSVVSVKNNRCSHFASKRGLDSLF
jgi:hypothetical protein